MIKKHELYLFLLMLLLLLKYTEIITVDYQVVILISIIFIVNIYYAQNIDQFEHMTNNEALQLISSLYNEGNMIVKNLTVTGDAKISGNASIDSNLTTKGSSTLGNVIIRDNKVGVKDSADLDFGKDNWIRAYKYGTSDYSTGFAGQQLYATNNINISSTSINETSFKILNQRKNNVAGYFGIKAYGKKIPLYYGWNMTWPDHNRSVNLVNRTVQTQAYMTWTGQDLRDAKDGDQNWTPRYLIVYPGYIAKLYYWDIAPSNNDIYTEGEYKWDGGSPRNLRVHLIYVSLVEEGPYNDQRTPSQLTG